MDKRVVGTLLGIAGMLLWFMPWMEFSMGDMDFYRTGSHIGGIAYLLLLSNPTPRAGQVSLKKRRCVTR